MINNFSRRQFIKGSVAAAAASALGLPVPGLGAGLEGQGWRWDKGVCRFCGVGCGLQIATASGRVGLQTEAR